RHTRAQIRTAAAAVASARYVVEAGGFAVGRRQRNHTAGNRIDARNKGSRHAGAAENKPGRARSACWSVNRDAGVRVGYSRNVGNGAMRAAAVDLPAGLG